MRGRDKLMEMVRGQPLICDRVRVFGDTAPTDVIVVVPPDRPERIAALIGTPAIIAINDHAATGMASSIKVGLSSVPPDTDAALFLPCDMPEIEARDIERLTDAAIQSPDAIIRAATHDLQPGNPVIFPRAYFPALMALKGDQSGRDVLKLHQSRTQLVALKGQRARIDLDTPEAWSNWRARNLEL